jgi:hypothetical protein
MYFGIYDAVVNFTEYYFSKIPILVSTLHLGGLASLFFFHVTFFVPSKIYRSLCHLISYFCVLKKPPLIYEYGVPLF